MSPSQLLAYLDELGLETATFDHEPVFTVEEARRLRGALPGSHTKSLFLRNKKGRMWLVTTDADRKIDLKRLFVTVFDHTTGTEHQLLFFKERFFSKDHPDRAKMNRFSAKLRKLGLRQETIGYGPTKEKWDTYKESLKAD